MRLLHGGKEPILQTCSVFQAKVIESRIRPIEEHSHEVFLLQKTTVPASNLSKCPSPKRSRDDENDRERDALEIQRQHEQFMDTQEKKAELYVAKRRKLATVSSKETVVDSELQRPGMEGKGPRIVPKSIKNYRKRLKKKKQK